MFQKASWGRRAGAVLQDGKTRDRWHLCEAGPQPHDHPETQPIDSRLEVRLPAPPWAPELGLGLEMGPETPPSGGENG